jgi:hypothetical protein
VTHLYAAHVGDRVKRPCGAANRQLQITLSRLLRLQNAGQCQDSGQQSEM